MVSFSVSLGYGCPCDKDIMTVKVLNDGMIRYVHGNRNESGLFTGLLGVWHRLPAYVGSL